MCLEEAELREIRLHVGLTSLHYYFDRIKVDMCQIAYGGFVVCVCERLLGEPSIIFIIFKYRIY